MFLVEVCCSHPLLNLVDGVETAFSKEACPKPFGERETHIGEPFLADGCPHLFVDEADTELSEEGCTPFLINFDAASSVEFVPHPFEDLGTGVDETFFMVDRPHPFGLLTDPDEGFISLRMGSETPVDVAFTVEDFPQPFEKISLSFNISVC